MAGGTMGTMGSMRGVPARLIPLAATVTAAGFCLASGSLAQRPPAGALAAIQPSSACRNGYRAESPIRDYALGRDWSVFSDCAHPERPRVAVAARNFSQEAAPGGTLSPLQAHLDIAVPSWPRLPPHPSLAAAVPAVQPGSRVRLRRETASVRIELAGTALDGGVPGSSIRVRTSPGGAVLRGTVRSAGIVELEAGAPGFTGERR
jgi:hypothetical protein